MMRNLFFLTLAGMRLLSAQTALPTEWIDPDTGHRVVRLSFEYARPYACLRGGDR
jgi:hypothetical protein